MDYAWRVGIGVGVVTYVFILFVGALFLDVNLNYVTLAISAICSVILGFVLEFFVFGGDYTRIENLAFEDDDYYYYVKAVPKISVSTSSRQIKKSNGKQENKENLEAEPRNISVLNEIPPVTDSVFEEYVKAVAKPDSDKALLNGNKLYSNQLKFDNDKIWADNDKIRVYNSNGDFQAVYAYNKEERCFKPFKMFLS